MLKLHSYFRSSAAFRVRIALQLKGLPHEIIPVHLLHGGGQQRQPGFLDLNPAGLVPVLEAGGEALTQSLAIIEYLDETHPLPPLLPADPLDRARVRALALEICCDIHPLNNLRVLRFLAHELKVGEAGRDAWYRHWAETGLEAIEARLARRAQAGDFCHGDRPTLADCCLVPQVFNARRMNCRTEHLPTVLAIHDRCMALPEFVRAAPAQQPDAG
ncbi:MAG: maleylacetoacetate isomerase [Aquabacterium sp.]|jgi:maleylacetoacetate isomerase|nr:MAG: maleylacetoacetate isomerase [Aquabacterium sp.]